MVACCHSIIMTAIYNMSRRKLPPRAHKSTGQLKEQAEAPAFVTSTRTELEAGPPPGSSLFGQHESGLEPLLQLQNRCIYTSTTSTAQVTPSPSYSASLTTDQPAFRPDAVREPDSFFNPARRNNTADQNTESQVSSPGPTGRTVRPQPSLLTTGNLPPPPQITLHFLGPIISSPSTAPLLWPASFSGTSMGRSYHSLAEIETQKTIMPMSRPGSTKSSIHPSNISILPASQSTRNQSSAIDRPPGPATVS